MVKAHPFLYIPQAFVATNEAGFFYGTGAYAKPAQDLVDAVFYVLDHVSKDVVYRNPNMQNVGVQSYNTIYHSDGEGYDPSVQNILTKYPERPILIFVDYENGQIVGILKGKGVNYTNIVQMYKLFVRSEFREDLGIYELKTPSGDAIPFVFDEANSHLVLQADGEISPKHSLLDLLYVGANLGLFDRPYLRDWFNKVLAGYKEELIDFGILALTAAGTGTAIISKNKKYKMGGAGVAAVSGAIFGYRVISRQKKQQEASTK